MRLPFFLFAVFSLAAYDAFFDPIPSPPEQIAAYKLGKECLIEGIVNPADGQFSISLTDLAAKGCQDIAINRVYVPPLCSPSSNVLDKRHGFLDRRTFFSHLSQNYRGWVLLPHLRLQARSGEVRYADPCGSVFCFGFTEDGISFLKSAQGISNAIGDVPSGMNDPRNIQIYWEGVSIFVFCPDGTRLFYTNAKEDLYLLRKEILPCGKVLRFTYDNLDCLTCIESLDPRERHVYASIHVEGAPSRKECRFLTQAGDVAVYKYAIEQRKEKPRKKQTHSKYHINLPPTLVFASTPFCRYESIGNTFFLQMESYSGRRGLYSCAFTNAHPVRVQTLFNAGKEPLCDIHYAGRTTTVLHANGAKTVYFFSERVLLEKIEFTLPDGSLGKVKIWEWNDKNQLASVECRNGEGIVVFKKRFEFDSFGNPIVEVSGTECEEVILREFSQDGWNLLLREEKRGLTILRSYLPGTNLLTAQLALVDGRIALRKFWIYDDCNNLIEEICDNGNEEALDCLDGLTQKTITRYRLRESDPFLHMPEWIETFYWENYEEKFLQKKRLIYNKRGCVAAEEFYGSDGLIAYTIYREIDERGNVISETDPMGDTKSFKYDEMGRCISAHSKQGESKFYYDALDRLEKEEAVDLDGIVRETSYQYDLFGGRTALKKISNGVILSFNYSPTGHLLAVSSSDGVIHQRFAYNSEGHLLRAWDDNRMIERTLDPFGRVIEEVFEGGLAVRKSYDSLGRLLKIQLPDESALHYSYDSTHLKAVSRFSPKGHVVYHEQLPKENETPRLCLREEPGFSYRYDPLGRLIEAANLHNHLFFSYDALGRLSSKTTNGFREIFLYHEDQELGSFRRDGTPIHIK